MDCLVQQSSEVRATITERHSRRWLVVCERQVHFLAPAQIWIMTSKNGRCFPRTEFRVLSCAQVHVTPRTMINSIRAMLAIPTPKTASRGLFAYRNHVIKTCLIVDQACPLFTQIYSGSIVGSYAAFLCRAICLAEGKKQIWQVSDYGHIEKLSFVAHCYCKRLHACSNLHTSAFVFRQTLAEP